MNPPLSAPVLAPERVLRPRDSHAVRAYGIALFVAGLVAGGVLLATGAPLPPWGPLLVLAVALALCINRYTFFPSELAVTAEAAVIFAAVVAFASDASFLGAWCVALLVGPLDALHWQQRSFTRMAHNAGDRMLAALAAAGAFQLVAPDGEGSVLTVANAVLAAVVAFVAVEVVLSTVLLRLHRVDTRRDAVVHALQLEVLTPALAIAGAVAGVLAARVGWWSTLLVLVPLPLLSEWAWPVCTCRRRAAPR